MSALVGTIRAGALSLGAEPSRTVDSPLCLLEGTVFNLAEIAGQLPGTSPERPRGVLLAAHERWGAEMPGRLRGSFAVAIHDPASRSTLLACDQLGGRSLFVHRTGSQLAFAADVRDLLRVLPTRPPPREAAVVGWIAGASGLAGGSLYRGIDRLDPGGLLVVDERGVESRRYWAPEYRRPAPLTRPEAVETARAGLEAAVARQLPDRGCGVLLSGGLDSSSVAALAGARRQGEATPRAYSAVFPDHPSIDESGLIGEVVAELGLAGAAIAVRGGSMVRGSLEYLREWELPAASPNHFLWQPLLRRAADDGIAVMLDGEGGDELWQASPYLLADRIRHGRPLAAARSARRMAGDGYRGWRSLGPYLRHFGLNGAVPASLHAVVRRRHGPLHYAPGWLTARSADLLFEHDDPWAWKRLDGPRWWAYMADLLTGARARLGVTDYLRHRSTMAGLEDRHPLIDVELVELALGLPPALAIDGDLDRPLIRAAMAGSIPDSIRLRPEKSYFTALFENCLDGRDLPLIRSLLGESAEVGRYLRPEAIRKLLDTPATNQRASLERSWTLWRLITAECWLRTQGDGTFVPRLLEECGERTGDWSLALV